MRRAYFSSTLKELSCHSDSEVLGALAAAHGHALGRFSATRGSSRSPTSAKLSLG